MNGASAVEGHVEVVTGRGRLLAEGGAAAVVMVLGFALSLDRPSRSCGHHLMKVSQHLFAPKKKLAAAAVALLDLARLRWIAALRTGMGQENVRRRNADSAGIWSRGTI